MYYLIIDVTNKQLNYLIKSCVQIKFVLLFIFLCLSTISSAKINSKLEKLFDLYKTNQLEEATEKLQIAIGEYTEQNDTARLIKSYWLYGQILNKNEDFGNAIVYNKKAFELSNKVHDIKFSFLQKICNALALNYIDLGIYGKAIELYEGFIKHEQFDRKSLIGAALLVNLSHCYSKIGDHEKSFSLLKESESIAKKHNSTAYLSNIWDEIGFEYYKYKKQYDQAIHYVSKAHQINLKNKNKSGIANTAEHLSLLYQENKQFEKALNYHLLASNLRDSIKSQETAEKVAELNIRYNIKRKENELAYKNFFIEQQHNEIENQAYIRYSLIGIVFLVLFFGSWLWILLKKNRNKLHEIQVLNENISNINKQLEIRVEERTKWLIQQNEKLKKYSFLNSHKVRAPLTKILTTTDLMERESKSDLIDPIKSSASELDQVLKEINNVLHHDKKAHDEIKQFVSGTRIMLIDDDPMQNFLSKKIFNFFDKKMDIHEYISPEDAIQDIKSGKIQPDVIFLDLNMPDLNGWEFLTEMEKLQLQFPVVMLTSSIDPDDRIQADRYEYIKAFVTKPLRIEDLTGIFSMT